MDKTDLPNWRKFGYVFLLISGLPFIFFGLIDPLEGGISLLVALAAYLLAFVIGKQKPKKYFWIPFVISIGLGALVLAGASLEYFIDIERPDYLLPLVIGNWVYRAAVVATLIGALLTVIRAFGKTSRK